jgi:uncharacterized iron-regulated membrane protein
MDAEPKRTKSSAKRVAKSLEAHSLITVIFGALIYILAVTGTLSVFNHDLQSWEQPDAPEMQSVSPEAAEKAHAADIGIDRCRRTGRHASWALDIRSTRASEDISRCIHVSKRCRPIDQGRSA